MSRKRHRELPVVNTQLVEIYEDLANVDEQIRLKAAQVLLTKFVSQGEATNDQLKEILRRLIRGLCSGRKAARLGFSVALTEFLIELPGPNSKKIVGFQYIPELVETLKKQSHVSGNVSGQEERDHHFGRLFGAEAIIKSGILFQSHVSIEFWNQLLDVIYELAKKKSWLREECGFVLYTATQILRNHDLKYAQLIIDKLHHNGLTHTAEGIAIWVAVRSGWPAIQFPHGVWRHDDALARKELSKVAKILKGAHISEAAGHGTESKAYHKGAWSAKVHFVWAVILDRLLYAEPLNVHEAPQKRKGIGFGQFWEQCVDDNLFTASSSDEQKYWGFLLFQQMITNAPVHLVPDLYSQNFMRCLMNQLRISERYLHGAAERAIKAMLARALSNHYAKPVILKALLTGRAGDINFDKITRTKTVETLLSHIDDSAFEQLDTVYDELIRRPGVGDEKEATRRRSIAAEQLVTVVRNAHIKPTADYQADSTPSFDTIWSVLSLLAKYAYFDLKNLSNGPDSSPSPPITQASQQVFRSRISSCLTHLMAQPIDHTYFPYKLMIKIHSSGENPENGDLLLNADDTVLQTIEEAREVLRKIDGKIHNTPATMKDYFSSLKLLFCLTLLQVYNEDPEAVSMLEELNDCVPRLILHSKDTADGSAALIEILLGLVSKPSQLFRRLTCQVFAACTSVIDGDGLQSMLKVLETRENLSGQAEIFDQNNEDEISSEAPDGGEVEIDEVNFGSRETDDDSDDAQSNDSHGSSHDNSQGTDDELARFDAKLAQALGTRPGNADLDASDTSSTNEAMNDDQMEALDEHLEKVFQERKRITSKKTEKKDAKEAVVNFKCRVLELIEIYVKRQHTNILALGLLIPLLTAIRTTNSPLVSGKACKVMREYDQVCKGNGRPKIENTGPIFNLIEAVHIEAMKGGSKAYTDACSQASLLLVRVLVAHNRETLRRVVKIYGDTQEKALFESSCMDPKYLIF